MPTPPVSGGARPPPPPPLWGPGPPLLPPPPASSSRRSASSRSPGVPAQGPLERRSIGWGGGAPPRPPPQRRTVAGAAFPSCFTWSARATTPTTRPESSIGTTTFDEGDAPIAFRVSRYWRLIVLMSAVAACSLIVRSARANPSARRIAACRSPSAVEDRRLLVALGVEDRGRLVALRDGDRAAFWPSASVTTARRERSADIWRVMASWTDGRRDDLADLDVRDLHAPALGDLVELGPQEPC